MRSHAIVLAAWLKAGKTQEVYKFQAIEASKTLNSSAVNNNRTGQDATQLLVEYSISEGVAFCYLNRPEKLNSFNQPMALQLISLLEDSTYDDAVRVFVLGARGKGFCAGQDLQEFTGSGNAGSPPDLGPVVSERYNRIIRLIREMPKPVVCAVNGVAAGAGANLALACDFVVASEEASFIQSFSKVGLIPDSGGTYMLPRLVGLARATAMCMLAEKISARQAFEMGMIYKVASAPDLENEAKLLSKQLAAMPTFGLGLTKRAFNHSFSATLQEQLQLEAHLQGEAGRSADFAEGVAAFLERRQPVFTGK